MLTPLAAKLMATRQRNTAITGFDVERAIFSFLDQNYNGDIDSGSPASFDNQGIDDWIWWALEEIREPPTRKQNLRFTNIRLLIHVWSKDRSGVKPAKATAETIAELFRHRVIEVTDMDAVGTPQIGYVEFFEPMITDMTKSVEPGFQCVVVVVSGITQET